MRLYGHGGLLHNSIIDIECSLSLNDGRTDCGRDDLTIVDYVVSWCKLSVEYGLLLLLLMQLYLSAWQDWFDYVVDLWWQRDDWCGWSGDSDLSTGHQYWLRLVETLCLVKLSVAASSWHSVYWHKVIILSILILRHFRDQLLLYFVDGLI